MRNDKKRGILAIVLALFLVLFAFAGCSGQNGRDGRDADPYAAYQKAVELGEFEGTYFAFLKEIWGVNITEDGTSLSATINSTLTNVVGIQVTCQYRERGLFGGSTVEMVSAGSGVFYSLDKANGNAYVVTNCHVVYDSFESTVTQNGVRYDRVTSVPLTYSVYLYGLETKAYAIPATVWGYSMENDIAVLKISGSEILKGSYAQAVTLGNSDEAYLGDEVFAIGNPLGAGLAVSSGVVSKDSETITLRAADGKTTITPRALRVSAVINEGNSGGGLFNAQGELIGVVFAKNIEDYVEGVGYALPVSGVSGLADSIIENCNGRTLHTTKAQWGVTTAVSASEQYFAAEANRFTTKQKIAVQSVGLASAAFGRLLEGDVILSVQRGNKKIDVWREWQIDDFLWSVRAGDTVTFTVLRGDSERTVEIPFRSGNFGEVV